MLTRHTRRRVDNMIVGSFPLGSVVSPYYPSGRGTYITTMKAIAGLDYIVSSGQGFVGVAFYSGSTYVTAANIAFDMADATDAPSLIANAETAINAYAVSNSYTLTSIFWTYSSTNSPSQASVSHSVVTGTGATGFQVSSSRNAWVSYSTTIVSTATISGNASGTVVLEIAPTNSATAGDWVEVSRFTNGQALTLALTLQSVQTTSAPLVGFVPAGYYAKIRSINNSGTPTYTYNSGQETLL